MPAVSSPCITICCLISSSNQPNNRKKHLKQQQVILLFSMAFNDYLFVSFSDSGTGQTYSCKYMGNQRHGIQRFEKKHRFYMRLACYTFL